MICGSITVTCPTCNDEVVARLATATQQPATAPVSHEDGELAHGDDHADSEGNASAFRSWHYGPRDAACVEAWPGCTPDAYDPRCCRFPKSCSCRPIIEGDE